MTSKGIVIIAPSFYPNKGGVEKHLEYTVKEIVSAGYNVIVLVRNNPGFPSKQRVYGADVYKMPRMTNRIVMKIWLLKHKALFKNSVVHSHDFFPFALRKLLPDVRWVHTFHGYEGYPLDPSAIKSRQEVAKRVDYTFCVGGFIEKWYGTKCNKVIYGATKKPKDFTKLSKLRPKWDYIFYGRFEEDTGFGAYIKAFKKIQEILPKASMIAVGQGSLKKWADDYIDKHKLNIKLLDFVNDINPYLYLSKVSFVSGYLAIIECGLAKKPIIAFYDTPIKKDYLRCHPRKKDLIITNRSDQIASEGIKALSPNAQKVKNLYNWSSKQTWQYLTNIYKKAYNE